MIEAKRKKKEDKSPKINVYRKSAETIRCDTNKKIVNDILYFKLSNPTRMQTARTSINSNMDLISTSQAMTGDTINNFKSLFAQMGPAPSLAVDFKKLQYP